MERESEEEAGCSTGKSKPFNYDPHPLRFTPAGETPALPQRGGRKKRKFGGEDAAESCFYKITFDGLFNIVEVVTQLD
jgi:hypothetical protein